MISANLVRFILGLGIAILHFIIIAILTVYNRRFDNSTQQTSAILILTPITLTYTVSFVKYAMSIASMTIEQIRGDKYNFYSVATMFVLAIMFSLALIFVVSEFVKENGSYDVHTFKQWLSIIETAFGGLLALVFEKLFGGKVEPGLNQPVHSSGRPETLGS